jgi:hypothetical protein
VHWGIFEAVSDRDPAAAAERLAHHYAVAGLSIIASLAPEYDPVTLRTALRAVSGEEPSEPVNPEVARLAD